MKFRNNWTNRPQSTGEVNTQPSQTLPDQTMSIPEILQRYARGLPITKGKVPIYQGEEDPFKGIDPKRLDLSELHNLKLQNEKFINDFQESQKQQSSGKQTKPEEKPEKTDPTTN